MTRILILVTAFSMLAACGGGPRSGGGYRGAAPVVLFAQGPIYDACQRQNRKAANRSRCGCVQAVADMSLSQADQKRGAGYFRDPGKLQEVRQSDGRANERFWKAWKAYGERAEGLCAAS